tara:strand:+ start:25727 stop:26113 length:387 start_codon:yes stop_codon:yes gene_type:complete
MSELKHLPKSIPAKDFEFQIDVVGKLTGERYHGDFKCKIPNNRMQANIAKHKARLNAGYDATLDSGTKNMHHMNAYCTYTITSSPAWFLETDYGYDLFDIDVLEAIYDEVLRLEEEWINKVWPDGQLS